MKKEQLDFDSIYLEEFNLSSNYYFEKVKSVINSNSNRKGSFIKQRIHDTLDDTQVNLGGFRKESALYLDRYFERLLAEFKKVTGSYKEAPITNFILNEYQELRKEFRGFQKPVRPDLYILNEVNTVKYLANYHALTKLFDKIKNISFGNEHTVEDFLSKVLDKDYLEEDYSLWRFVQRHTGADFPNMKQKDEDKTEDLPTIHAIAYHLLFEAEPKRFPKGIKAYEKYCEGKPIKASSFKTLVNDAPKRLKGTAIKNLEAVREVIERNSCETALKAINKIIEERNKDKDL